MPGNAANDSSNGAAMNTPDGYPHWDQFARERFEALQYADRHPGAYPQTREEEIRDMYSPDTPQDTADIEDTDINE